MFHAADPSQKQLVDRLAIVCLSLLIVLGLFRLAPASDPRPVFRLAIGRLAVAEPAEVRAIAAKTIRHIEQGTIDPRPRRTVWIASEDASFQHPSKQVARFASEQGFAPLTIYPRPDEASNVTHQARLRQAWNEGPLLVHFYGHGGRYIWRTGPPNHRKNHDLFTLDDLDRLAPTDRLPVVLSMSCFSAPFDHERRLDW